MSKRLIRIALILLLLPPILAALAGWLVAPAYLHPIRRELTPDLIREADTFFSVTHADPDEIDLLALDAIPPRGYKVTRRSSTLPGARLTKPEGFGRGRDQHGDRESARKKF